MKRILSVTVCLLFAGFLFFGCSNGSASSGSGQNSGVSQSDPVKDAANAYFADMDASQYMITPSELFAKIDSGDDLFLLDIRPQKLYQDPAVGLGHLKGALNLPFGMDIAQNIQVLPTDKVIVIYDDVGNTAAQLTALLSVCGYNCCFVQSGYVGISNAEGYEKYVDNAAVALPSQTYTVDPPTQTALDSYFNGMLAMDGTDFEGYSVTPTYLKSLIDVSDGSYYLLSVQSASSFAQGHIATAVNIPFATGMQQSFANIPMDKTIIVYCYWGDKSYEVMTILRLLGYNAYALFGGSGGTGWENMGYPLVTN